VFIITLLYVTLTELITEKRRTIAMCEVWKVIYNNVYGQIFHRHFLSQILLCSFLSFALVPLGNTESLSVTKHDSGSEQNITGITTLITDADQLVKQAISSQANASRFRIDATFYRESLRSLMIEAEKNADKSAKSKKIFMELVRMSALLQSAAACKTGRYIVCPVELRLQLLSQQARLHQLAGVQS
jgi:hypothetical protein